MKIAVLAWGSLIPKPKCLKISGNWHFDGPKLPIEYARISCDGRLTLVIYENADDLQTLWAYSYFEDLDSAVENLRCRENTPSINRIGYVTENPIDFRSNVIPGIDKQIRTWAKDKNIDAVIWTDLPSNFEQERKIPLTE